MADETDKTNSGPSLSADPKELSPDGVDITAEQDGGLYKTIKTPGTGDSGPQAGDKVFVHYVGTLANGEKFDSSRDRGQKFDFTLGQGSVIKGWDVGVATMKKGEVAVLTCRQDYAYGSRGSPPKIPPNATLLFEVELFEWKGEDISPESDESIVRSKIKTGKQGSMPVDGAKVKVHIVGKHKDTTFEDREVEFELGDGAAHGIIPGIEHALTRFHKQECSNLIMKSKHAYGTTGCPEKNIPPNADLEYQVTLIEFEKMKDSWEMEADEKIEQSEIAKGKGNGYFKSGNYKRAVQFYQRIVNYLDSESSLEGDAALKRNDLLLAAYLNHAQCALKLNDLNDVYECCNKALEIKPDSEKAYFRKGQAKLSAGEHEEAIKDFQKVLEIDSENKAAKNQIIIAQHHIKQEKARSKKLYGGMFDKFAAIDAKKEKETPTTTSDEGEKVSNGESKEEPEMETEEGQTATA